MLFRRKKKGPEQRRVYRQPLASDDALRVTLARSDQDDQEAGLLNLTMRGAGVRLLTSAAPAPEVTEVLEVSIESPHEGWTISTPGIVRRVRAARRWTDCGIEFINLGNLYSQMDDSLASYFNRRARERIPHGAQIPTHAELISGGQRLGGVVFDLSTHGVGMLVRHVESIRLRIGAPATVRLRLPRSKRELEGGAFLRQVRALYKRDIVGLEFDLTQANGFAQHHKILADHCARRLAEEQAAAAELWDDDEELGEEAA